MDIKYGTGRVVLVYENFVIKIPYCRWGIRKNESEFKVFNKYGEQFFAKIYKYKNNIIFAEKLTPLNFKDIIKYFIKGYVNYNIKPYINQLNQIKPYKQKEYQIGISKEGNLKYFDYEELDCLKTPDDVFQFDKSMEDMFLIYFDYIKKTKTSIKDLLFEDWLKTDITIEKLNKE